jgi:hypothetical protein
MLRWKSSQTLVLWTLVWCGWSAAVSAQEGPAQEGTGQPGPPPAVYLIFDGSGSMWGQLPDGTHKVTAARQVLDRFVGQDFGGRELALRAYGHRREGDCADTELVVGFAPASAAAQAIRRFAEAVNPKGKTPIGRSLRAALEDMGERSGEIILISDGIETCDDDPCALVRAWREQQIAIRVHVVGLGLSDLEKAAMQCIAEAAGTEFQDAQSAEQLAAGLETIRAAAASEPGPATAWQVLDVVAATATGEAMRVEGVAERAGFEPIAVGSDSHNRVPPGAWQVTVGVRTANGNLYRPVTRTVEVGAAGATKARFEVVEPPSVQARFVEAGEARQGALVRGFQDGVEVLTFRPQDRTYLDPGSYEFRSVLNQDNPLAVHEEFLDGEHKEILFEAVQTVHVQIRFVAQGGDEAFGGNPELWQDGEKRYGVHRSNGALVLPGTYEARLPLKLTPYAEAVTVSSQPSQEIRIEVPVGYLTVRYQNADGSPIADERCVVERLSEGPNQRDGIQRSGRRIPLTAGRYRLEGWSRLGDFDPVEFEIAAGQEREIILRSKR